MRILIRAGHSPFQVSPATQPKLAGFGNSGNILFAQSVYKSLYKAGNQIDVDEYRPDFASADEINEKYDAVVLPLANAFRPQFETRLRHYTALIRGLNIPCVVTGIGAQAGLDLAEIKGSPIDPSVREFVSAVLDRSATIGVRGQFTYDYLNRLGFGAVDIIGCPSLFLNGANIRFQGQKDALGPCDGIAVNHDPAASPEIQALVLRVLDTCPGSVFVAQQEADAKRWADIPPIAGQRHAAAAGNGVRYFKDVPPWIEFMKTRVFSIGTRIHGNIAAVLAGVPAVVIAHDSRTLELAMHHKIPYILENAVTETTQIAALYEAADFAPFHAAAGERFDHYKAFLRKNGLDHAHDDPQNAAAFESRVATMTFPDRI